MPRILKAFKEGDAIPEGARFVSREEVKDAVPYRYSEEIVHRGIFSDVVRTYAHYKVRVVFMYEVGIE